MRSDSIRIWWTPQLESTRNTNDDEIFLSEDVDFDEIAIDENDIWTMEEHT